MKNSERKEEILVKYIFTETETIDLAKRLAQVTQKVESLEEQKKSVVSDFKAQIDREACESSLLATKIASGYEMRRQECLVELFPKEGKKRFYHPHNGELVREDGMSAADYQVELPLKEEEEPQPDSDIDQDALGWLTATPVSDMNFTSHLERANLATLRKAHDFVTGVGVKKKLAAQIKKLEAAGNPECDLTKVDGDPGFLWNPDGSCQNPVEIVVNFGSDVYGRIFMALDKIENGEWHFGTLVDNVEQLDQYHLVVDEQSCDSIPKALTAAVNDLVAQMETGEKPLKKFAKVFAPKAWKLVDEIDKFDDSEFFPNAHFEITSPIQISPF